MTPRPLLAERGATPPASRGTTQPGLISVIIPTFRRYAQLRLAAQSSVEQTHPDVEVIVVADGPDPLARQAVAGLGPRLRYCELPSNAGPAAARNFGVAQSRGEWLTFLDDDDTMHPERLARQFAHLDPAEPHILSACRMVYQHGNRQDIWPARPLLPGEDIADYLLVRPSLLGRPGVLSLQSLLMHYSVIASAPLSSHADHEDWAWLLEAWHYSGVRIRFLWQPLVTYTIATETSTRSRRTNWQDSLDWALQYRGWLSNTAFNSFLASKVALKARRAGSLTGLLRIVTLLAPNRPCALDLLLFFGICALPGSFTHRVWKRSLRASPASPPTPALPAIGCSQASAS